jgi:3-hydroxyacyl-CoA dehydrogenase
VRDRDDKLAEARANPALLDDVAAPLLKKARGQRAPAACIECVRAAVTLPFDEGLALERKLFVALVASDESRAQRHVFFAEREALKVPGVPADLKPAPVKQAVIIGAGTMGGGIAMCFANAGIPVTIIETKQDALDRGMAVVEKNYRTAIARGSMAEADLAKRMASSMPLPSPARCWRQTPPRWT